MKLIVICRYDRQKLNLALFAQAEAETSLGQQVLDRCWNWKGANGCEPGENHPWGHEWNLPKCSYNLIISRFWRWDSCDAGTPGGLLLLRCDCYTAWCGAEMMRQAASISNMPGTVVEFLINISFYFLISFWSAVWSFVWGMAQQRTAWIWHGAEARGFATLPEFNVRNLICLFRKYGRSETDQAFWCQCSTGSRYQASVPGMVLYVILFYWHSRTCVKCHFSGYWSRPLFWDQRVRQENLGEGFVTEFPLKSGSPQAGYTIFQGSKRFIGCGIAPTWLDFSAFRCLYPLVFLSGYGTGSKHAWHAKAGELNDFKHAATHLWSQTVSWTSWRGVTSQEHVFCIAFSTWSVRCCSTPSKTKQRIFCVNHRNWLFLIDGSCHFWTQWLPIKLLIAIM